MKKFSYFIFCASTTILTSCNEAAEWTSKNGCVDDETRCDKDSLYVCKDAEWVIGSRCAEIGKICGTNAEFKSVCIEPLADSCVPSCKDGKVTHCDSDGIASIETCPAGMVCGLNASGVPACVNEIDAKFCTPMCKDGLLTTCDDDMNSVTSSCDDNKVCGFNDNGVPACVDKEAPIVCTFHDENLLIGTKTCDDHGNVVECQSNGVMSDGVPCERGLCSEGVCVP